MKHVQESIDDQINRRMICDIEEKHDLFFFEISIRQKVRQCSSISQKDLSENDSLILTFATKTLSIRNDQAAEKN
jgi:hypothetical protein